MGDGRFFAECSTATRSSSAFCDSRMVLAQAVDVELDAGERSSVGITVSFSCLTT